MKDRGEEGVAPVARPNTENPPTRRAALDAATTALAAAGIASPHRDAELILLHVAHITRTDMIGWPDTLLTVEQNAAYQQAIKRRKANEPIQHILGEQEFYGLRFEVTTDVLIPRPETEHLVEAALERIPMQAHWKIADVGTGSGIIAVTLARSRANVEVTALDISPAALEIARRNAEIHGVLKRIPFLESDLLAAVAEKQFDMVVSNPPYIAETDRETLEPQVRDYEPGLALFGGPTGLEIYQRLIPQAARILRPDGWLLMEIGAGQDMQLKQLLIRWKRISFVKDLQGIPRVAIAQHL
jgi:release factor glutamine methyltransferase